MDSAQNEEIRQVYMRNLKELEEPGAVFAIPDRNLIMVRIDNPRFSSYMQRSEGFPAGGILENVRLPSGTVVTIYVFEAFDDI